mgnify:CR=1 FL=1
MGNRFASGKNSIAQCDRCDQRFKLKQLKREVIKGRNFYFTLHHATPGPVTVKLAGVTVGGMADHNGNATVMIPASPYGIFSATATSGAETATTKVYVPSFSLRNSDGEIVYAGRRGHFLTLRVEYIKFGTVVSVLSGNQLTSRAAWTTSVAKVTFRVPNFAGPASILVNLAGQNKVIKYWVK